MNLTLLIILSSLGYLFIGWATVIVAASLWGLKDYRWSSETKQPHIYWWFTLPFWPFTFVALFIYTISKGVNKISLKIMRKLNPKIMDEWYNPIDV